MLRLEGLYGTAPAQQSGGQFTQVANPQMVNSRGGTSWMQQYVPQAAPAGVPPGVANAMNVAGRMGARPSQPAGAPSNSRIQPQGQVPPAVAQAMGQMGYSVPLNGQRPVGGGSPNTQQAAPGAQMPTGVSAERPMGGPVNNPANDRIGAEGAAASSYRPLYNPREVNPNRGQVSPRAQAMFEEMRKRAAMSPTQGMAYDRGVFSGGQQAAQMPGLPNGGRLAALYG